MHNKGGKPYLNTIFCVTKVRVFILVLFTGISIITHGQNDIPNNLALLFQNQLEIFPQEKIYLHTDKPYYISGEKIWFRAYLVDAMYHIATTDSRYVYVELINPLDSVVTRIKIRENEGAYWGHLPIPDDVPEGDYTLRAYTTYMRSLEENYFFTKTLHIGDPQARTIQVTTDFFFESDRRVYATLRFSNVDSSDPLVPQSVKVTVNEGRVMDVNVTENGSASINFNLPANARQRTMFLEVTTNKNPYRKFIQIPLPDSDFDVSFYPEGGSLMMGTACNIAFKALNSNGQAIEISGVIYRRDGTEINKFSSVHQGMGSFSFLAQKGETYYAVCENEKGQSKRFELPAAMDYGVALAVTQLKDNLYVSVRKPADDIQNNELYLLAHTRGLIHMIDIWDQDKNLEIISKEWFPSGVLHLILFNADMNPVSERLVFIHNPDQAQVSYQPDKESYASRSLVKNSITITGSDGLPVSGSFSVAVTSDSEVVPDSTSNILTQLLLSSDLRGHIACPAYYFQNTTESTWALDLLMLTQGWRRYNITELAQGRFSKPNFPLELGPQISGVVKTMPLGRPVADAEVRAIQIRENFLNSTLTDNEGRFFLPVNEFPDSTRFIVSVEPQRRQSRMDLILDKETFPEITLPAAPSYEMDRKQFAQYVDKAEQQYLYEGGIRVTLLSEAVVTGERRPPRKSEFYSLESAFNSLTEEQLTLFPATSIYEALSRFSGVVVQGKYVFIGGSARRTTLQDAESALPLILLDGMTLSFWIPPADENDVPHFTLDDISMDDVAQIDILKGNAAAIFGSQGFNGVISIFTGGKNNLRNSISTQALQKTLLPLGYQQPIEFYAPKYETQNQNNSRPDLRTTIHWIPVVQTTSRGMASFEFYTADEATSYTVTIEGLADNGTIIQHYGKVKLDQKP